MADPNLQQVIWRWKNRAQFFRHLLREVCQQCVKALQENTPGTELPKEWDFEIYRRGQDVEARVFTHRIERKDQNWELILNFLDMGTRPHMVYPTTKLALSWLNENGVRHFSKGHMVSGIQPSFFAAKTDRVIQRFERTIQRKFETYMNTGRLT
jgi:hypothetical protein